MTNATKFKTEKKEEKKKKYSSATGVERHAVAERGTCMHTDNIRKRKL